MKLVMSLYTHLPVMGIFAMVVQVTFSSHLRFLLHIASLILTALNL